MQSAIYSKSTVKSLSGIIGTLDASLSIQFRMLSQSVFSFLISAPALRIISMSFSDSFPQTDNSSLAAFSKSHDNCEIVESFVTIAFLCSCPPRNLPKVSFISPATFNSGTYFVESQL